MSAVGKSLPFPNLFLVRPDGTSLELVDLRKKQHALVMLFSRPDPDAMAFVGHFQDQARLFDWLGTRLLPVFARRDHIPTPWPAPAFTPCLHTDPLPEGLGWDKAYVVSKNGTLLEQYEELPMLSVHKVEQDLLYWEAGHCLP
jgi:hypothetical protein